MAFIPLFNGVKVEVKFTLAGQLVVNVYHFESVDPIVTANLTALAALIKAAWIAEQQGAMSSLLSLNEIVCTDVSEEEGLQVIYTAGLPEVGESASPGLPNNVALVVKNFTDQIGRSRRGRTYIAGITETDVNANIPSNVFAAACVAYHTAIAEDALAAGFIFGVASYQHNNAPRVTAEFTPFTGFSVDMVTDSQRRRLPGRGA